MNRSDFINPRSAYHGEVKPENLVFDANLQEFSNRVSLLCGLQTNGKISPQDCYCEIKQMWKQLKHSKKALGIGQDPFQPEES